MMLRRSVVLPSRVAFARLKHMQMTVTDSGVAVIRLDCQGEKQNTLSKDLLSEFEAITEKVDSDASIKSAVLLSGKKDSWIAGANIKMIEELAKGSAEEAEAASKMGQVAMGKINSMKTPWVAAIDGACLGGGLEMALSCDYRVATSSQKTVLGVPEVMIGLLPGSGGTQRLPPLVGAANALDMMLTGKNIKPVKAKKMGLVDAVVDPNALERTAISMAEEAARGSLKPKVRKLGWMDWFLEKTPPGRALMFQQAEKKVRKQTNGKYPAPFSILECAKVGLEQGMGSGLKVEANLFGKLAATPESSALRGLFFGQTESKKNKFGEPSTKVETVGILGAGLMGALIGQVSASKGFRVLLKDKELAGLSRGKGMIQANLGAKLKKKRMTQYDHDSVLSNIVGLTDVNSSWTRHFSKADLVIEAVFEEMSVKHKVIAEMEAVCPPHCIIASNTSTLPIGEIAAAAKRPENVVGMHYFSPADKMPLLEVIPHAGTAKAVSAAAVDFGIRQGKTVIAVKDVPGFYVNRCLGPFLTEAVALLQEGADPIKINSSLTDFGYPVGGISLADEVGIDVARHVVNNLIGEQPKYLGVRMEGCDLKMLDKFVEAGLLGRKTGKGFFSYDSKNSKGPKTVHPEAAAILKDFRSASKNAEGLSTDALVERMVLRFLGEAVHCLQSGVIATPRDGDIGAVFGIGFPPFLGGPFMYIDRLGADNVVEKMLRLQAEHGDQFAPPELLVEHAKANKPFHA
jgi:enoyl-CoA hydratase/long-chain 3-hydroxyacyl-CoA dehydrogenase